MNIDHNTAVAVVGGGFTGLAAAYELALACVPVTVLEAEAELGGLAVTFDVGGEKLERFYHHWFTSDLEVMQLIEELGLSHHLEVKPTNTSIYYAHNFFRLSSPLDLLRFRPLGWMDRVRLGLLTLRARHVTNWQALENKTAKEWLLALGGKRGFEVVWEPLLKGKFGLYADEISAVWFWNKLKLRGGSRSKGGAEHLAYLRGGFARLVDALAEKIKILGGRIETSAKVQSIRPINGEWRLDTGRGAITSKRVLATNAPSLVADLLRKWANSDYVKLLKRIQYLANICLILELDRPLSKTYWLNVCDPSFPFVGVIEHTNFARPENYGGRHIVYLSKYLPPTDKLYTLSADELLDYALPYLQRMFPGIKPSWILAHHVWRARWAQPIVERNYSRLIPSEDAPVSGLHLCSMAQIYPEDRGTNYAVRSGRRMGRRIAAELKERTRSTLTAKQYKG